MAAVFGRTERAPKFNGKTCQVPRGDIESLSYYLCCINSLQVGSAISADLADWRKARSLPDSKRKDLLYLAYAFYPPGLLNKLLLVDDEHELLPKGSSNKFLSLNEINKVVAMASAVHAVGVQIQVSKVMICTKEWLNQYWIAPMKKLKHKVAKATHSTPNVVQTSICGCETILKTSSLAESRRILGDSPNIDHPEIQCDSCMTKGLRGDRYKCRQCADVDLCSSCYLAKRGGHLGCGFYRISKEGEPSVMLVPRDQLDHPDVTCDQCKKEGFNGPRYECQECEDYDLCEICYRLENDRHLQYRFWRINKNDGPKMDQAPRRGNHSPVVASEVRGSVDPAPIFAPAVPVVSVFTPGQRVRITGLSSSSNSKSNGCYGVVEKEIPGGQKYVVNIPGEGKKIFQVENLEVAPEQDDPKYPVDACAELTGLVSMAHYNGKYGIIQQQVNGKIVVRLLDENRVLTVKKENLNVIDEAG